VEGLDVWTRWKARNRSFGFVAVLVLIAASHDVLAQALPAANLSPTVPTGKKRMVGFFTGLNPDCSSTGEIEARVIKQPENGTVDVEPGTGFTNFPETNQRYACNLKPSPGVRINYTSKDGFVGKDAFEVEFLGGTGGDVVWKYIVTVK
jgi:hypothetical protein